MSSIRDFAQRLHLRIQAEYGTISAALVARAGLDSLKDCELRGYLRAVEDFQAWVNDAMKEMNEDLPVPFRSIDPDHRKAVNLSDDPEDEP